MVTEVTSISSRFISYQPRSNSEREHISSHFQQESQGEPPWPSLAPFLSHAITSQVESYSHWLQTFREGVAMWCNSRNMARSHPSGRQPQRHQQVTDFSALSERVTPLGLIFLTWKMKVMISSPFYKLQDSWKTSSVIQGEKLVNGWGWSEPQQTDGVGTGKGERTFQEKGKVEIERGSYKT